MPHTALFPFLQSKNQPHRRGEYNVYSTFQSHEPEFDYLKSLEIEEKINKIRWLPQQNAAYFLLSTNGTCPRLGERQRCRPTASVPGPRQPAGTCSVVLLWEKDMSENCRLPARVTRVSRGSRNLTRTVWQSSVPVHHILSLFHSILQGRESLSPADNLHVLFFGSWELFFFKLFFFF